MEIIILPYLSKYLNKRERRIISIVALYLRHEMADDIFFMLYPGSVSHALF
jgi:hypothetical protein